MMITNAFFNRSPGGKLGKPHSRLVRKIYKNRKFSGKFRFVSNSWFWRSSNRNFFLPFFVNAGFFWDIAVKDIPQKEPSGSACKLIPTEFPGVVIKEQNRIYDHPRGYAFGGEGGEPEYFMHRYLLGIIRDKKRMKLGWQKTITFDDELTNFEFEDEDEESFVLDALRREASYDLLRESDRERWNRMASELHLQNLGMPTLDQTKNMRKVYFQNLELPATSGQNYKRFRTLYNLSYRRPFTNPNVSDEESYTSEGTLGNSGHWRYSLPNLNSGVLVRESPSRFTRGLSNAYSLPYSPGSGVKNSLRISQGSKFLSTRGLPDTYSGMAHSLNMDDATLAVKTNLMRDLYSKDFRADSVPGLVSQRFGVDRASQSHKIGSTTSWGSSGRLCNADLVCSDRYVDGCAPVEYTDLANLEFYPLDTVRDVFHKNSYGTGHFDISPDNSDSSWLPFVTSVDTAGYSITNGDLFLPAAHQIGCSGGGLNLDSWLDSRRAWALSNYVLKSNTKHLNLPSQFMNGPRVDLLSPDSYESISARILREGGNPSTYLTSAMLYNLKFKPSYLDYFSNWMGQKASYLGLSVDVGSWKNYFTRRYCEFNHLLEQTRCSIAEFPNYMRMGLTQQLDLGFLLPTGHTKQPPLNHVHNTDAGIGEIGQLGSFTGYPFSSGSTSPCLPLATTDSHLPLEALNLSMFDLTPEGPNLDIVGFGDPLNFYSNRSSVRDRFGLADYVPPSSVAKGSGSSGYGHDWNDFRISLWDDSTDFFLRNTIFRRDPRSSRWSRVLGRRSSQYPTTSKALTRDEYRHKLMMFQTLFMPVRPLRGLAVNDAGLFRLASIGPYSLSSDSALFKPFLAEGLHDWWAREWSGLGGFSIANSSSIKASAWGHRPPNLVNEDARFFRQFRFKGGNFLSQFSNLAYAEESSRFPINGIFSKFALDTFRLTLTNILLANLDDGRTVDILPVPIKTLIDPASAAGLAIDWPKISNKISYFAGSKSSTHGGDIDVNLRAYFDLLHYRSTLDSQYWLASACGILSDKNLPSPTLAGYDSELGSSLSNWRALAADFDSMWHFFHPQIVPPSLIPWAPWGYLSSDAPNKYLDPKQDLLYYRKLPGSGVLGNLMLSGINKYKAMFGNFNPTDSISGPNLLGDVFLNWANSWRRYNAFWSNGANHKLPLSGLPSRPAVGPMRADAELLDVPSSPVGPTLPPFGPVSNQILNLFNFADTAKASISGLPNDAAQLELSWLAKNIGLGYLSTLVLPKPQSSLPQFWLNLNRGHLEPVETDRLLFAPYSGLINSVNNFLGLLVIAPRDFKPGAWCAQFDSVSDLASTSNSYGFSPIGAFTNSPNLGPSGQDGVFAPLFHLFDTLNLSPDRFISFLSKPSKDLQLDDTNILLLDSSVCNKLSDIDVPSRVYILNLYFKLFTANDELQKIFALRNNSNRLSEYMVVLDMSIESMLNLAQAYLNPTEFDSLIGSTQRAVSNSFYKNLIYSIRDFSNSRLLRILVDLPIQINTKGEDFHKLEQFCFDVGLQSVAEFFKTTDTNVLIKLLFFIHLWPQLVTSLPAPRLTKPTVDPNLPSLGHLPSNLDTLIELKRANSTFQSLGGSSTVLGPNLPTSAIDLYGQFKILKNSISVLIEALKHSGLVDGPEKKAIFLSLNSVYALLVLHANAVYSYHYLADNSIEDHDKISFLPTLRYREVPFLQLACNQLELILPTMSNSLQALVGKDSVFLKHQLENFFLSLSSYEKEFGTSWSTLRENKLNPSKPVQSVSDMGRFVAGFENPRNFDYDKLSIDGLLQGLFLEISKESTKFRPTFGKNVRLNLEFARQMFSQVQPQFTDVEFKIYKYAVCQYFFSTNLFNTIDTFDSLIKIFRLFLITLLMPTPETIKIIKQLAISGGILDAESIIGLPNSTTTVPVVWLNRLESGFNILDRFDFFNIKLFMGADSFDTLFQSIFSMLKKNPNLPNLRISWPATLERPAQLDGIATLNSLNIAGSGSLVEGGLVDSLKILARQGLVEWREALDQWNYIICNLNGGDAVEDAAYLLDQKLTEMTLKLNAVIGGLARISNPKHLHTLTRLVYENMLLVKDGVAGFSDLVGHDVFKLNRVAAMGFPLTPTENLAVDTETHAILGRLLMSALRWDLTNLPTENLLNMISWGFPNSPTTSDMSDSLKKSVSNIALRFLKYSSLLDQARLLICKTYKVWMKEVAPKSVEVRKGEILNTVFHNGIAELEGVLIEKINSNPANTLEAQDWLESYSNLPSILPNDDSFYTTEKSLFLLNPLFEKFKPTETLTICQSKRFAWYFKKLLEAETSNNSLLSAVYRNKLVDRDYLYGSLNSFDIEDAQNNFLLPGILPANKALVDIIASRVHPEITRVTKKYIMELLSKHVDVEILTYSPEFWDLVKILSAQMHCRDNALNYNWSKVDRFLDSQALIAIEKLENFSEKAFNDRDIFGHWKNTKKNIYLGSDGPMVLENVNNIVKTLEEVKQNWDTLLVGSPQLRFMNLKFKKILGNSLPTHDTVRCLKNSLMQLSFGIDKNLLNNIYDSILIIEKTLDGWRSASSIVTTPNKLVEFTQQIPSTSGLDYWNLAIAWFNKNSFKLELVCGQDMHNYIDITLNKLGLMSDLKVKEEQILDFVEILGRDAGQFPNIAVFLNYLKLSAGSYNPESYLYNNTNMYEGPIHTINQNTHPLGEINIEYHKSNIKNVLENLKKGHDYLETQKEKLINRPITEIIWVGVTELFNPPTPTSLLENTWDVLSTKVLDLIKSQYDKLYYDWEPNAYNDMGYTHWGGVPLEQSKLLYNLNLKKSSQYNILPTVSDLENLTYVDHSKINSIPTIAAKINLIPTVSLISELTQDEKGHRYAKELNRQTVLDNIKSKLYEKQQLNNTSLKDDAEGILAGQGFNSADEAQLIGSLDLNELYLTYQKYLVDEVKSNPNPNTLTNASINFWYDICCWGHTEFDGNREPLNFDIFTSAWATNGGKKAQNWIKAYVDNWKANDYTIPKMTSVPHVEDEDKIKDSISFLVLPVQFDSAYITRSPKNPSSKVYDWADSYYCEVKKLNKKNTAPYDQDQYLNTDGLLVDDATTPISLTVNSKKTYIQEFKDNFFNQIAARYFEKTNRIPPNWLNLNGGVQTTLNIIKTLNEPYQIFNENYGDTLNKKLDYRPRLSLNGVSIETEKEFNRILGERIYKKKTNLKTIGGGISTPWINSIGSVDSENAYEEIKNTTANFHLKDLNPNPPHEYWRNLNSIYRETVKSMEYLHIKNKTLEANTALCQEKLINGKRGILISKQPDTQHNVNLTRIKKDWSVYDHRDVKMGKNSAEIGTFYPNRGILGFYTRLNEPKRQIKHLEALMGAIGGEGKQGVWSFGRTVEGKAIADAVKSGLPTLEIGSMLLQTVSRLCVSHYGDAPPLGADLGQHTTGTKVLHENLYSIYQHQREVFKCKSKNKNYTPPLLAVPELQNAAKLNPILEILLNPQQCLFILQSISDYMDHKDKIETTLDELANRWEKNNWTVYMACRQSIVQIYLKKIHFILKGLKTNSKIDDALNKLLDVENWMFYEIKNLEYCVKILSKNQESPTNNPILYKTAERLLIEEISQIANRNPATNLLAELNYLRTIEPNAENIKKLQETAEYLKSKQDQMCEFNHSVVYLPNINSNQENTQNRWDLCQIIQQKTEQWWENKGWLLNKPADLGNISDNIDYVENSNTGLSFPSENFSILNEILSIVHKTANPNKNNYCLEEELIAIGKLVKKIKPKLIPPALFNQRAKFLENKLGLSYEVILFNMWNYFKKIENITSDTYKQTKAIDSTLGYLTRQAFFALEYGNKDTVVKAIEHWLSNAKTGAIPVLENKKNKKLLNYNLPKEISKKQTINIDEHYIKIWENSWFKLKNLNNSWERAAQTENSTTIDVESDIITMLIGLSINLPNLNPYTLIYHVLPQIDRLLMSSEKQQLWQDLPAMDNNEINLDPILAIAHLLKKIQIEKKDNPETKLTLLLFDKINTILKTRTNLNPKNPKLLYNLEYTWNGTTKVLKKIGESMGLQMTNNSKLIANLYNTLNIIYDTCEENIGPKTHFQNGFLRDLVENNPSGYLMHQNIERLAKFSTLGEDLIPMTDKSCEVDLPYPVTFCNLTFKKCPPIKLSNGMYLKLTSQTAPTYTLLAPILIFKNNPSKEWAKALGGELSAKRIGLKLDPSPFIEYCCQHNKNLPTWVHYTTNYSENKNSANDFLRVASEAVVEKFNSYQVEIPHTIIPHLYQWVWQFYYDLNPYFPLVKPAHALTGNLKKRFVGYIDKNIDIFLKTTTNDSIFNPLPFSRLLDYSVGITQKNIDLPKEYAQLKNKNKAFSDEYILMTLNLLFPTKNTTPQQLKLKNSWVDESWYTKIKELIPQPNGQFIKNAITSSAWGVDIQKAYKLLHTIDDEIDKFASRTMMMDRATLIEMQTNHKKNIKTDKIISHKSWFKNLGETFKLLESEIRLQPSTRWRFGAWLERRKWEKSLEVSTLFENMVEYVLSTPIIEAYSNIQNLYYTDMLGIGTSYLNYIATRIIVPCIYIKKRVNEWNDLFSSFEWEPNMSFVDPAHPLLTMVDDSDEYSKLPYAEAYVDIMTLAPFVVIPLLLAYLGQMWFVRKAQKNGGSAYSNYYVPTEYLERTDWFYVRQYDNPKQVNNLINKRFPTNAYTGQYGAEGLDCIYDDLVQIYQYENFPEISTNAKPEIDILFGIDAMDPAALEDIEGDDGYKSPEWVEEISWTAPNSLIDVKRRIGDRHITSILAEAERDVEERKALLWAKNRDVAGFDNVPGVSTDEFGHILYVNSRRVFFDQLHASIKLGFATIAATSWFWASALFAIIAEITLEGQIWEYPMGVQTLFSPQFWNEWSMVRAIPTIKYLSSRVPFCGLQMIQKIKEMSEEAPENQRPEDMVPFYINSEGPHIKRESLAAYGFDMTSMGPEEALRLTRIKMMPQLKTYKFINYGDNGRVSERFQREEFDELRHNIFEPYAWSVVRAGRQKTADTIRNNWYKCERDIELLVDEEENFWKFKNSWQDSNDFDVYKLTNFFEEPKKKIKQWIKSKINYEKKWEEDSYKRTGQSFDTLIKSNQNHTTGWGEIEDEFDPEFDRIDPDWRSIRRLARHHFDAFHLRAKPSRANSDKLTWMRGTINKSWWQRYVYYNVENANWRDLFDVKKGTRSVVEGEVTGKGADGQEEVVVAGPVWSNATSNPDYVLLDDDFINWIEDVGGLLPETADYFVGNSILDYRPAEYSAKGIEDVEGLNWWNWLISRKPNTQSKFLQESGALSPVSAYFYKKMKVPEMDQTHQPEMEDLVDRIGHFLHDMRYWVDLQILQKEADSGELLPPAPWWEQLKFKWANPKLKTDTKAKLELMNEGSNLFNEVFYYLSREEEEMAWVDDAFGEYDDYISISDWDEGVHTSRYSENEDLSPYDNRMFGYKNSAGEETAQPYFHWLFDTATQIYDTATHSSKNINLNDNTSKYWAWEVRKNAIPLEIHRPKNMEDLLKTTQTLFNEQIGNPAWLELNPTGVEAQLLKTSFLSATRKFSKEDKTPIEDIDFRGGTVVNPYWRSIKSKISKKILQTYINDQKFGRLGLSDMLAYLNLKPTIYRAMDIENNQMWKKTEYTVDDENYSDIEIEDTINNLYNLTNELEDSEYSYQNNERTNRNQAINIRTNTSTPNSKSQYDYRKGFRLETLHSKIQNLINIEKIIKQTNERIKPHNSKIVQHAITNKKIQTYRKILDEIKINQVPTIGDQNTSTNSIKKFYTISKKSKLKELNQKTLWLKPYRQTPIYEISKVLNSMGEKLTNFWQYFFNTHIGILAPDNRPYYVTDKSAKLKKLKNNNQSTIQFVIEYNKKAYNDMPSSPLRHILNILKKSHNAVLKRFKKNYTHINQIKLHLRPNTNNKHYQNKTNLTPKLNKIYQKIENWLKKATMSDKAPQRNKPVTIAILKKINSSLLGIKAKLKKPLNGGYQIETNRKIWSTLIEGLLRIPNYIIICGTTLFELIRTVTLIIKFTIKTTTSAIFQITIKILKTIAKIMTNGASSLIEFALNPIEPFKWKFIAGYTYFKNISIGKIKDTCDAEISGLIFKLLKTAGYISNYSLSTAATNNLKYAHNNLKPYYRWLYKWYIDPVIDHIFGLSILESTKKPTNKKNEHAFKVKITKPKLTIPTWVSPLHPINEIPSYGSKTRYGWKIRVNPQENFTPKRAKTPLKNTQIKNLTPDEY